MNIDHIFKFICLLEVTAFLLILGMALPTLLKHWHTSLAGLFVFCASLFIEFFYQHQMHRWHDPVETASLLAVAIALLLTADAHGK